VPTYVEPNSSDQSPICVNVYFHIIRNSNGTGGGITPSQIPQLLNILNEAFNPHNILISNAGQDFIDNDAYALEFNDGEFNALTATQNVPNAVNIYLLPVNPLQYAGRASAIPGRNLVVGIDYISTSTLPHELGHCLNLFHTHHQLESGGCGDNGSNCNVCGDYVCDTPVDPLLSCGSNVDPTSCAYIGGGGYTPDTRNIMSYSCRTPCRNRFSAGQGLRMRISLLNDPLLSQFVTANCVKILGNSAVCNNTTQTYSLQNPPANATFQWIVANTNVIQIQGSNTNPTVNVISVGNGKTELRCNITLPSGTIFATKDITSGSPQMESGYFVYNGQNHPLAINYGTPNPICKGLQATIRTTWSNANTISWTGPANNFPAVWYDAGFNNGVSNLNLYMTQYPVTGNWTLTASNGCGVVSHNIVVNSIYCANPCEYFTVSPNPNVKGGEVSFRPKDDPTPCGSVVSPAKDGITAINFYDEKGILFATFRGNKAAILTTRLPMDRKGLVIAEIISGTYSEKHKIIVQ
jgi:hypothetical protein